MENHLKNFSFYSRTLKNEIPFSFSSRNWRIFFQISLSLLDWTFLPLVTQCCQHFLFTHKATHSLFSSAALFSKGSFDYSAPHLKYLHYTLWNASLSASGEMLSPQKSPCQESPPSSISPPNYASCRNAQVCNMHLSVFSGRTSWIQTWKNKRL